MNGPEAGALAFPGRDALVRAARAADKPVITGAEVIALQAARQFELYTGVSIIADQVERASAFSRESADSESAGSGFKSLAAHPL